MTLVSEPPVTADHVTHIDTATLDATPGVLTVDLEAIAANWSKLESRAVPAECAAVVKANAYGCGLVPVTRKLGSSRRKREGSKNG